MLHDIPFTVVASYYQYVSFKRKRIHSLKMQVFSSNLGKRAPVHRVLQPALSVRARQTSCGAARKRRVTVTPEEEELTCEILVDEGSRVFSVSLAKPLGLVLEEGA